MFSLSMHELAAEYAERLGAAAREPSKKEIRKKTTAKYI